MKKVQNSTKCNTNLVTCRTIYEINKIILRVT